MTFYVFYELPHVFSNTDQAAVCILVLKHTDTGIVSIGYCSAAVDKRVRSTSLYHCRQCSIVLAWIAWTTPSFALSLVNTLRGFHAKRRMQRKKIDTASILVFLLLRPLR